MASITKDRNRWRAMVRRQGHKPISKNFKTRTEAKSWAREMESALEKGDLFSITNKTVTDLIDRYLEEHPDLIRYEKTILLWWRDKLGKIKLREFRKAHVVQARKALQKELVKKGPNKGQPLAPATINRRVALLSRVCALAAEEWDWLTTNPCHIRSITENNERDRILTPEERDRLLAVLLDHPEPALLGFMLVAESTGMRAGEIRALRWKDINHDTGAVEIIRSKNGDKRVVFVGSEALQWLRDWRKENRLRFDGYVFGNATGKAPFDYLRPWKDAKEQAGLEDLRFHDLRHGFVTAALRAGANPTMLQLVTGHRSSAMLKRYAHLVTDVAQQIGKAVDGSRSVTDKPGES